MQKSGNSIFDRWTAWLRTASNWRSHQ